MSSEADLMAIASHIRRAIEPGIVKPEGSADSSGACLHASVLLAEVIGRFGFASARIRGGGPPEKGCLDANGVWRGHYWVEADLSQGDVYVLDITADQFGHPEVRVLDLSAASAWYRPGDQEEVDAAAAEIARSIGLTPPREA